ncbi:MaoC/PaaZ C-terminal domain-containing protein [Alloyangia pacifica]|uniref:MaoC/PaaZ C-terminal domain-containing protein n=1 Tax=Alloyangia pacifica TaxID=311180 RepID=UPI0020C7EC37|nr:MaoC/PaaZ C-terminal domain-containing protein [Alloyangia pacifica]
MSDCLSRILRKENHGRSDDRFGRGARVGKRRPRHLAEIEVGEVRERYGRTLPETVFFVHAGGSGDFFPHHMDAESRATSEFGGPICRDAMIFSIGVGLTATEINLLAFSCGHDPLRFVRPVVIADPTRTRVTAARAQDDPGRPQSGKRYETVEGDNPWDALLLARDHIHNVQKKEAEA